jgi:hypothetical protein
MLTYLASSVFFYFTYYGLDEYASDYFPESTKIVTKKYRICNTVKSGTLALLCIPGTQFLYQLAFYPELVTPDTLNLIGAVYTATDAAALVYNPNCHQSTLIHHVVVQLFYYYCWFMNFDMDQGAARGIGIYCILSSYAYLVNGRLALRFTPNKQLEHIVNEMSIFIYITSCVINWITQTYLVFGGLSMHILERIIYLGALGMTINDDIFLIAFLRKIDNKKPIENGEVKQI